MSMNMLNPNKNFISVILDKEGRAEGPSEEDELIDPEQGLKDAAGELIKAIKEGKTDRVVRAFKAMAYMCDDDEQEDEKED